MSVVINRHNITQAALVRWLKETGQGGCTFYLERGTPFAIPTEPLEGQIDNEIMRMLGKIANSSETGSILFRKENRLHLLLPPFPVQKDAEYSTWEPSPLLTLLDREPWICVVLLRLGRYAIGIFHGKQLVSSKSGSRLVKGRHHAGGTSQARFARRREGQVDALFKTVCQLLQNRLESYQGILEHLFFGGEHQTLQAFRNGCPYLANLASLTRIRNLNVRTPGQQALENLPSQLWTSQMFTVDLPA